MKTLKNILKVALVSLPLIFGGCRDVSNDFSKYKEKDGFTMRVWNDGIGNHFRIDYGNEAMVGPYLHALDRVGYSDCTCGDARFDEIHLRGVPIGDKLEKYAYLDSINKLYKEVKETGIDK